jgi:hypothetical protein
MCNEQFEVMWPRARATKQALLENAGLGPLQGKTIAFVWDYMFRGDDMHRIIKADLDAGGSGPTVLGPDLFGDIHGPDERQVMATLGDRLREYAVDAAIVGVGA